jgi:FMN phosphatase YigB (HAD superfamily)
MAHVGDLWEQDFIAAKEAGLMAFHLDRRGERKDGSSLTSLAELEERLQEK